MVYFYKLTANQNELDIVQIEKSSSFFFSPTYAMCEIICYHYTKNEAERATFNKPIARVIITTQSSVSVRRNVQLIKWMASSTLLRKSP